MPYAGKGAGGRLAEMLTEPRSMQTADLRTLGNEKASSQHLQEEQDGAAGAGHCLVARHTGHSTVHGNAHVVKQGQQEQKGEEAGSAGSQAHLQAEQYLLSICICC